MNTTNLENERYIVAEATGTLRNNLKTVATSETLDIMQLF